MARTTRKEVHIAQASESDLDSLTTIVPRAFHPVNPYIKRALPDAPSVRTWWKQVFTAEIKDPTCHVLVARDPDATVETVIGTLCLRLMDADDRGAGFWTLYPPAVEMDQDLFADMTAGMPEYRAKLMSDRASYLLELFGVDHDWKGTGVGLKLLGRACEIADGTGHDVFVQANGGAKSFYEKLGFRCEAEVPISEDYVECMLVRKGG